MTRPAHHRLDTAATRLADATPLYDRARAVDTGRAVARIALERAAVHRALAGWAAVVASVEPPVELAIEPAVQPAVQSAVQTAVQSAAASELEVPLETRAEPVVEARPEVSVRLSDGTLLVLPALVDDDPESASMRLVLRRAPEPGPVRSLVVNLPTARDDRDPEEPPRAVGRP